MTTRIVVVSGGLSEESSTHRLAEGLSKAVRERAVAAGLEDVVVQRFDIRDMAQEIASAFLMGFASGKLAEAYDALGQADGVIARRATPGCSRRSGTPRATGCSPACPSSSG